VRAFDPVKAGKVSADWDWEDMDEAEAEAIAECEALIASGYYDQCMCGRNGDHGLDYDDEFDWDDYDFNDEV
jgi:hypothetical protein